MTKQVNKKNINYHGKLYFFPYIITIPLTYELRVKMTLTCPSVRSKERHTACRSMSLQYHTIRDALLQLLFIQHGS